MRQVQVKKDQGWLKQDLRAIHLLSGRAAENPADPLSWPAAAPRRLPYNRHGYLPVSVGAPNRANIQTRLGLCVSWLVPAAQPGAAA